MMRFWRKSVRHTFELVLPLGVQQDCMVYAGDRITITRHGDPEPFCIIEHLATHETRITFLDEDEHFTQADLELLAYIAREQPLVI